MREPQGLIESLDQLVGQLKSAGIENTHEPVVSVVQELIGNKVRDMIKRRFETLDMGELIFVHQKALEKQLAEVHRAVREAEIQKAQVQAKTQKVQGKRPN